YAAGRITYSRPTMPREGWAMLVGNGSAAGLLACALARRRLRLSASPSPSPSTFTMTEESPGERALARVRRRGRVQRLLAAPLVGHAGAVHAADRAVRRALLRGVELARDVFARVARERDAGRAALLRAVVHEPVLADVQVPRAGAALPVVRLALEQVVLKAA